jgi:hypothetical protein
MEVIGVVCAMMLKASSVKEWDVYATLKTTSSPIVRAIAYAIQALNVTKILKHASLQNAQDTPGAILTETAVLAM